ncbi:tetratricopeptide repeat protein [Flaviflagellibacter deserti]|uniref:Tetratricopeptide repeat protein n=1 Tax=Flaviflagellibacter deserti TaxID=2267266 RepID=A0ABV9Z324_9HYPH
MSDIFNEIEEDLRREKLDRLWKRFGPLFIAIAVLIVLGVAGWRGWEWYADRQSAEAGAKYNAALALAGENKHADAETQLQALAKDGPAGYALLARFRAAAELSLTKPADGVAAFEAIGQDVAVPQLLRDLARVRAAMLLVDSGSYADVASRAEPLAAPGNTWRHAAREALALAAWKAGNLADARRWAEALVQDVEAPGGARARGQVILDLAAGSEAQPAPTPAPAQPAAQQ